MYENAVEYDLPENAPRWCLAEDLQNGGLYWHFIDKNLGHAELSCSTDAHKVRCEKHVFAAQHSSHVGHQVCPDCLAAMSADEKTAHGL